MKNFGKKLLSLTLSLMFILSLATVLPASAEGTVTATVNGNAISSGDAIPAVSTVVFTLPNEITEADLATAVVFEEEVKGAAEETWYTRLYKGEVAGNTLTVTFAEGALATNSNYRFTFKAPAVAVDETFAFSTTQVGDYYINDDFSRYPEVALKNPGSAAIASFPENTPWVSAVIRSGWYQRVKVVQTGTDSYLQLSSPNATNPSYGYMVVGYDNAYVPAFTSGGTTHTTETEISFSISGNPESIFELGYIAIAPDATNAGSYGVYVRTADMIYGNASTVSNSTKIGSIAVPTATDASHTLKTIMTTTVATPNVKKMNKVWLDGNEITLPDGGVGITLHSSATEDVINYNGGNTGLGHVFAVGNFASGEDTTEAVLKVSSYKCKAYVPNQATITPSAASGSTISNVGALTYTFSEPMNAETVLAGVSFYEKNSKYVSTTTYADLLEWNPREVEKSYDAASKTLTLSFAAGDLAANADYKVVFADTIRTAEDATVTAASVKTYTYKTQRAVGDIYYVNENFDRYPTRAYTYNERLHYGAFTPFVQIRGYLQSQSAMVNTNGDKGFKIGSHGTTWSAAVGYDNSYAAALPAGKTEHTGTVEVVASFEGNQTGTFEIGDTLIIRTDGVLENGTVTYDESGTIGLYARTAGVTGTGDGLANESYGNMTRLATLNNVVNSGRKHTIKYVVTTVINPENNCPSARTLHAVYIDGVKVETNAIPAGGLALIAFPGYSQGVFFNTGKVTRAFCVSNNDANSLSSMTVYSLKYGDAMNFTTSGDKEQSITIMNNTGAAMNTLVVLAVYNGNTFVGVDGLNAAAVTINDGATQTITRNVANAVPGNTYKIMLLDSKTSLKPFTKALEGSIK
ncbi:MAG: hypothetical protein IJF61_02985 [Clostridia bacterium]|nr:hypothetical protein [Clostridia bacterium]